MRDRITLRFMAAPTDAAHGGGTVQAGRVLEWIDKAGFACAAGYSGSYCVTAYVGNVHYTAPIRPGSLIEASARITHTGRSSMHVFVTVEAADPRTGEFEVALDCLLVFVAVDEQGKAKAVPPWRPRTSDDELLARGSEERIEARKRIHDLHTAIQFSPAMTGPSETFRFLANPTDVNWGGNAHGGIVMRWIDETSTACAAGYAGADPVAVYTGGIHFYRPIHIGHIVEIETRLLHTGPRSMHILARTRTGDPRTDELELATQCMSVYVVRGADGDAMAMAPLVLRSEADRVADAQVREIIAERAQLPPLPVPRRD
ncbi:acyl-CoA hydrolase [Agrococcus sp. UYP33]